jgi:serine/threonine protein phosphatase PrpC
MEIYAATKPQDGNTLNEDAFLIGRGEIPFVGLCDGSGRAQQAGRRALNLFEKLIGSATPRQVELFPTWDGWTRLLDSSLLGGAQSTFIAIALLEGRIVGACAGDSRLYLVHFGGEIQILTEEAPKSRLGSGQVIPFAIHSRVGPGDVVLLMSDGAWTPLNLSKIQMLRAKAHHHHFSEFPAKILEEAGKNGRADDMTVIAILIQ